MTTPRFSAKVLQVYKATGIQPGFTVRAATATEPAEIMLHDEIGMWGVTSKDFAKAMMTAGAGPLRVRINSPGGDVFDGMAIYNMLKGHPGGVETVVDGLAASAASVIAMAGNCQMAESSMMMIHNAWCLAIGNRHDLTDTAGTLAKVDGTMADIYTAKTGKPVADVAAIMDAETWYTAAEAKEAGFADEVVKPSSGGSKGKAASARATVRAAMRVAFDPDGDGDDDAAAAVSLIQSAIGSLADAIEALTGTEPPGEEDAARAAARDALDAAVRENLALRARIALAR